MTALGTKKTPRILALSVMGYSVVMGCSAKTTSDTDTRRVVDVPKDASVPPVAATEAPDAGQLNPSTPPTEAPSVASPSASSTPHPVPEVSSLRFSKIVAGRNHVCGLTLDDARLVCFQDDVVLSDEPGPYRDFSLSEETSYWEYRCTVSMLGELQCRGSLEDPVPEGEFRAVYVGMFNACARRVNDELVCWVPGSFGGFDTLVDPGGAITVSQWSLCSPRIEPFHDVCYDRFGERLLPREGHYLAAVAAPGAGCAAIFGYPDGSVDEIYGKDNVACFTRDGAESKLDGLFMMLDVNVNGDGCAIGGTHGVECWGPFSHTVPEHFASLNVRQLSVSTGQACVLDDTGKASCFSAGVQQAAARNAASVVGAHVLMYAPRLLPSSLPLATPVGHPLSTR